MTGLRAAARTLLRDFDVAQALAPPAVVDAAERTDAHGPGLSLPRGKDYGAVALRVMADLGAGRTLSRADLRDAAWCVWGTRPALSDDPRILSIYLAAVMRLDQLRAFRSLATCYLLNFRRDLPEVATVARSLAAHAAKAGLPWSDAQDIYGLFDPESALRRLVDKATTRGVRPQVLLDEIRLGRLPRQAGLLVAVHANGLERLRASENHDPLARLAAVAIWGTGDDGTLIAPQLATLVTEALLAPFRGQTPDRDVRDRYVQFVLRVLGDPRRSSTNWGQNQKNEAIVRRWLGEQSLRVYLEVVGKVAPPEHWDQRRAFWESLYRASLIDDAAVVLEVEGATLARRLFGDQVPHGRFEVGRDMARGTAVLILKVGALVIVDWSHGGPCIVWDPSRETGAPPLHQSSYATPALRKPIHGPDTLESHAEQGVFWRSSAVNYDWQDQVAGYLRRVSGVRLPAATYRV